MGKGGQALARRHVPLPHDSTMSADEDGLAVRTIPQASDADRALQGGPDALPGLDVPLPHLALAAGQGPLAIGAEGNREHTTLMRQRRTERFARLRLPKSGGLVP